MDTNAAVTRFELVLGMFVLYFNALMKLAMFKESNFLQHTAKRSRQPTCGYRHRKASCRGMISWLLILIMIVGPFQASTAMHANMDTADREAWSHMAQFTDATVDIEEHQCITEQCQQSSDCTTHFNCSPISLVNSPQLSIQIQIYHHDLISNVAVSTRFPDLLKRPPRFQNSI